MRRFADEHAPAGRRVRVVGETDYGTTVAEWREWDAYEAVVNVALAPHPLWGLCVVDRRSRLGPVARSASVRSGRATTAVARMLV